MKKCPKCSDPHTKPGIFCSRSCANSRQFSESAKAKKSKANIKDWQENRIQKLTTTVINAKNLRAKNVKNKDVRDKARYERILLREWSSVGYDTKRWFILYEQNNRCNNCSIDSWLAQPISLEIDHIDGNRYNDDRKNLEAVCPNCHSLTTTWRGKHRKKKIGFTDQEIYDAYIKAGNLGKTIDMLKLRNSRKTQERILTAIERIIPRCAER